jgi:indole-3-acetate O-methyltransferase
MGDNVVVSNMKLERLLSMKGGKGESSYANNSQGQVISS